ncbi:hypothetical protein RJ640_009526 [Escallonia rubra]|uniref:SWIM-type domain-containing protein n=1 Tax=Escallonia rubra TaxID=112253 RepID=A0AA88U995_9ASTE|nr:hypothetical protein RJ640_009526 [Escallonia rubra]
MGSHSFQLIEEIDAVEGLTDFDILDTHVGDEPRVDDVYDLSQCDDEVRTPRENEGYENFDNDSQPIDGKTFNTLEAAYDFYNRYALLNGFGTRKHNAHKIRATGAIFRRQFVCNKEGFKKVDDKRPNVNEKRHRDLRIGCEAMMQVTLSKMFITILSLLFHQSTIVQTYVKSLVSDLNHEGLKASQITRVVNVMKPSEEADVTPRQCSSIIRIERKNNVGKECYGIIKHFQEKATWVDLNDKYDLKENWWIQNMYNIRAHWAKPFLKDTFFASMTTSGRSESIHSFFDGYVNSNTMLNEFVVKYDNAVYNRRYAEEDEDFKTMNSRAVLSSDHPIEARVGECYTRSVFEIFKKEWNASVSCSHITLSKETDVTRYRVGLITVDKEKWRTVHYYSSENVNATCSCAKFETAGILCKHIIYILKKKKITDLPEYYILPRWTIHARYKVGDVGDRMDEIGRHSTDKEVRFLTLWFVRAKFSKAIDNGRNCPSEIHEIDAWLSSFLEKQAARNNVEKLVGDKMVSQVGSSICVSQTESMHQISIRDPAAPIKTKGRPKVATRLKSSIELAKEEKTQRTCAYCHGKGHYRTGCAKRKVCKFRAGSIFPFLMNMKLFRHFDVAIHMFLRFNCNSLKAKTPIISSESGLDMHNYIKPEIDAVSQKAYLLASNVIALIEAMDCKSSGSANSFATSRIAASLASTPRSSTIILYKVIIYSKKSIYCEINLLCRTGNLSTMIWRKWQCCGGDRFD